MRKVLTIIWRIIAFPFKLVWSWINNFFRGFKNLFTAEPEDTPLPDAFAKAVRQPMDILDHLNELRKHAFRGLAFLMVTTAISLVFVRQLIDWLTEPIGGIESLQAIEVTEPIGVVMRICLLAGFSAALPYLVLEIWLFAAPGLKRRSRILGLFAIPIAFLFFVGGMAFAYYVMMPTALPFLLNFMDIPTAVRPASYVKFVTGLMFWIGLIFEFPLVIFALAGMGIVRAQDLLRYWRIAVVVIAIIAAAITPTIDPVSMGLVMGPMVLLYFLSIGLAFIAQGRREKRIEET